MAKKKSPTQTDPTESKESQDQLATVPETMATEGTEEGNRSIGSNTSSTRARKTKSAKGSGTRKKGAKRRKVTKQDVPKQTSPVEDFVHAGELMFQAVDLVMKAGYKEAQTLVEMAGKMVDRMRDK